MRAMDERAEIWIARDPETNAESRPVSLRKLRKGVQIARLKPTTLVTRIGANEWVTLERLLTDHALLAARAATPPPPFTEEPQAKAIAEMTPAPPRPTSVAPPPVAPIVPIAVAPKPPPPVPAPRTSPDESASLTEQWFMEPPPEPGDDEPIFTPQTSIFDVRFERVGSVKLVRLAYVLMLTALAGAVLVSVIRALVALASSDGTQAATAVALVPVVALACTVVGAIGRMILEVLLSLSRIADRLTALTRAQRLH
jgi:hypothetical protein